VHFHGDLVVETVKHDLSSYGFYCLANAPFIPGEIRRCTIDLPIYQRVEAPVVVSAHCRVRVVRVESLQKNGLFGVGCCIEEYCVHVSS
jgi:hypothetical protein